jgi:hypothetical protein
MSQYDSASTIERSSPRHDAYAVEVDDTTVGIVIRDDQGFTFFASSPAFFPLEQQRFSSPVAAQKAAQALAVDRRGALRHAAARR